ncbi:MAG: hypothetical protein IPH72_10705 [Sandaracinaceae bacterium]|nr:hypothetical protein [Sandaracinaceae bacterium]
MWSGRPSIADLDGDGTVEVDAGSCQTIGGQQVCRVAGGGPPTIGNFDASDASPEVALAGAYNYVVFDVDLAQATPAARMSELWHRATNDDSSRKTGSSIFDFDGDGAAEVVYNDQVWLRVMEGDTGETLYRRCNTSATLWEYPVIADVDDNGHAEDRAGQQHEQRNHDGDLHRSGRGPVHRG